MRALLILQRELNTEEIAMDGNRLTLTAHLDEPGRIARALIDNGVELTELHRQETTLEEYFIKLVGGERNA
jgi:hypothetical protein